MHDLVIVDTARVTKLSREFSALSGELGAHVDRFHAGVAVAHGVYGQTPEAGAAESEYHRTVREVLEELQQLGNDLRATADLLGDQASAYREAEQDAELLANSLSRRMP